MKIKLGKKRAFDSWWFVTILIFSVKKIQRIFRGFKCRKRKICRDVKKEIKQLKMYFDVCRTFRRVMMLRNILCILRKNVLFNDNERKKEEVKITLMNDLINDEGKYRNFFDEKINKNKRMKK